MFVFKSKLIIIFFFAGETNFATDVCSGSRGSFRQPSDDTCRLDLYLKLRYLARVLLWVGQGLLSAGDHPGSRR